MNPIENAYRDEFRQIFSEKVQRPGTDALLEWLDKTDFYIAPASTKYHMAEESGLVKHSLNVYKVMREHWFDEETDSEESFAICGLLHDLCKSGFYKSATRNVKNNDTGRWEPVQYYTIEDSFPFGHGEKSVFMAERFIRLKTAEAVAIRWHMGGFDCAAKGGEYAINGAYEKYPLAVKLHLADVAASYLIEIKHE